MADTPIKRTRRPAAAKPRAATKRTIRPKATAPAKPADTKSLAAAITDGAETAIADIQKSVEAAVTPATDAVAKTATTARRAVTKTAKQAVKTTLSTAKSATTTARKQAGAAIDTVEKAAASLTAPIADAIAPTRRRVARTQRDVAKTAKRRTSTARKTIVQTARRVRDDVEDAATATTAAVTGKRAATFGVAAVGLLAGLAMNLGRKALVQAPSTLAGDWLEAVKAEHRLAIALFDKLQATDDSQVRQRTVLLTQLKHALGKHAFTEENVIYPALRAWGDKADADKLNHDHGYVKQYLYELDSLDKGAPTFRTTLADFRAALEAHIDEEERAIFPPLHRALGKAGNARVTAQANKEGFKLA